jgi:hypothetical protein
MPPVSAAQRRAMFAAESGHSTLGIPESVGREFAESDPGGKLPEHVRHAYGGGLGSPHLHFQFGGGLGVPMSLADPFWTRSEARQIMDQPMRGGLIPSSGAGRTDQIPLSVAADSHVLPAAEVSGLGQGNTLAGARIMDAALRIGPYGTPLPSQHRGPGPPRPPSIPRSSGYGEGGAEHETSILAAGGEYVIPRHDWVSRDEHGYHWLNAGIETLGEGDISRGHKVANNMIMNIRNHVQKFLRSAPPPKK